MTEIIAVIGATGQQGGSVIKALLEYGKYSVRAVTRNVDSDKGKELAKVCKEVVQANIDDVESLKKAFQGVYGAFFVTNFLETLDPEQEIQQMKNLADAAKSAGVKHAVVSSLEDTRKIIRDGSMPKLGKYYVPNFDGKGEAQDYVRAQVPSTMLLTCSYYENFITFGGLMGPKPAGDGTLLIEKPLGQTKYAMVAKIDIGRIAAKLFEDSSSIGKTIGAVSSIHKLSEVAEIFTKVLGKPVTYKEMDPSHFAKLGFPGAESLANMFQYERDYHEEYLKHRNLETAKNIVPELLSLEEWIEQNKAVFLKMYE